MISPVMERLAPGAICEEHRTEFARIEPWLRDYYRGYANSEKLISLLSFWLFAHRCLLACYGADATQEYARRGVGSHLRFAYLAEFDVDITLPRQTFRSAALFHAAMAVLGTAYLPGGRVRSPVSKLMWRLTKLATSNLPIVIAPERKRALVSRLVDCFGGHDELVIESSIKNALPPAFAANQIHGGRRIHLRVDSSASALMDFCGFENLLLLDWRLNVIGRQHGGGYDVFGIDYWVEFEKALCDTFIGWGMSEVNERQHRYTRVRERPPKDAERRVIIVERPLLPAIMYPMSPPVYRESTDPDPIEYVHSELTAAGTDFYSLVYPGALQSPAYTGMRGKDLASVRGRGESVLRQDDVPVFDISAASLIHYCIENDMTFVIVVGRESEQQFSRAYRNWLAVLRDAGLAFFADETGMLRRSIADISVSGYELPARVRQYHRGHFIEIPAVAGIA